MQIEDLLYQNKLHLLMLGKSSKPEKMTDDEWELLDRQALGVVRLSLGKSVAWNDVSEKIIYGLSDIYEKPSPANKVFLIRQLVNVSLASFSSAFCEPVVRWIHGWHEWRQYSPMQTF